jgi:rRNA maturation RNase YbeY
MPVEYAYNTKFKLSNEKSVSCWLNRVIVSERRVLGALTYAFFNDEDLKKINIKYLNHDYYTDVISFKDSSDEKVGGDIAISVDRVIENAKHFNVSFDEELRRVMVHGLLHFLGFNDKTKEDKLKMTQTESLKMKMFHVEQ